MGTTTVSNGVTDTVSTALPTSDSYIVEGGGTLDVVNGGTVSGNITIDSSGTVSVTSGGLTLNTLVHAGGIQGVAGGIVSSTNIQSSGQQVIGTGSAVATTVQDGGSQVMLGGFANDTTLSGGGTELVDGGTAKSTTVDQGAVQSVGLFGLFGHFDIAGTALLATVESGGSQVVAVGSQGFIPLASETVVESGGQQWIEGGGSDAGTEIQTNLYGGTQFVGSYGYLDSVSGGVASDTAVISSGSVQSVDVGGTAFYTAIDFGAQYIYDGTATSAIINSGGTQYDYGLSTSNFVFGGNEVVSVFESSTPGGELIDVGSAITNVITLGGTQSVGFDQAAGLAAVAISTFIEHGGLQWVSNGVATDTTISSGGVQSVFGAISGRANDTTVSGGTQDVYDGAVANTATLESSGLQDVYAAGTAISTTISSGSTQLVAGADSFSRSGTVSAGGTEIASSGGATSNTVIGNGGAEVVGSGGMALTTIVASSAVQDVLAGGSGSGTFVEFGGLQYIGSNGTAIGTQVEFGGAEEVFGTDIGAGLSATQYDFGIASGGTTYASGYQLVALGAVAGGMTVSSGGQQYIGSGGTALATDIASEGAQVVFGSALGAAISATQYDFAYASGGTVYDNGDQLVAAGASAIGMTVESGGLQYIGSGGTAIGGNIAGQGAQEVFGAALGAAISGTQYDFGLANAGTINSGGYQLVAPGAEAIGMTVLSGGEQYIGSGGTALETDIAAQGAEVVFGTDSGALISGTQYLFGAAHGGTTYAGGYQLVAPAGAGTAIGMTVLGSGQQYVAGGGVAIGTQIMSQGVEFVHGTDQEATISGTQYVYGLASAAVVATGGYQLVYAGGTVSAGDISGGTIELSSGASAGAGPTVFLGAGELILDASTTFSGTVAGFDSASSADSIAFADIPYVASGPTATTVNWTPSGSASGTLTVSEGGQTANVTLLGQYTGTFNASAAGGGTLVTYAPAAAVTDSNPLAPTPTPHA